jgi:hypothetical protein
MPFDGAKTDNPALTVLRKARTLLADPQCWGRGHLHVPVYLPTTSAPMTRYCMLGALAAADGVELDKHYAGFSAGGLRAQAALIRTVGVLLWEFNDRARTSHADVMAAFDHAEELLIEESIHAVR